MSRIVVCLLILAQILPAADVFSDYIRHRFNSESVQVKDIQGLSERVKDGKLHLRLKDFLELALKNSTDIQLTRLDVYTAADQITSAKAPFDPTLGLGYNTLRSVTPLFFQTGGTGSSVTDTGSTQSSSTQGSQSTQTGSINTQVTLPQTINSLSQNSSITYNQLLPTGQTINTSFSVNRSSGDGFAYPTLF
ncbi:MAG: hypothetical protein WB992_26130, partial [Bryobacteraceae bacterium]